MSAVGGSFSSKCLNFDPVDMSPMDTKKNAIRQLIFSEQLWQRTRVSPPTCSYTSTCCELIPWGMTRDKTTACSEASDQTSGADSNSSETIFQLARWPQTKEFQQNRRTNARYVVPLSFYSLDFFKMKRLRVARLRVSRFVAYQKRMYQMTI